MRAARRHRPWSGRRATWSPGPLSGNSGSIPARVRDRGLWPTAAAPRCSGWPDAGCAGPPGPGTWAQVAACGAAPERAGPGGGRGPRRLARRALQQQQRDRLASRQRQRRDRLASWRRGSGSGGIGWRRGSSGSSNGTSSSSGTNSSGGGSSSGGIGWRRGSGSGGVGRTLETRRTGGIASRRILWSSRPCGAGRRATTTIGRRQCRETTAGRRPLAADRGPRDTPWESTRRSRR